MPERCAWRPKTRRVLDAARALIEEYRSHWPMTLRAVFYELVSRGVFPNDKPSYAKLGRILASARLEGLVPWEALEDRSRRTISWTQWADSRVFIQEQFAGFLEGFSRDCLRTQDMRLEIWIEKDTVSGTITSVANSYGIPVVVARGFCSLDYVHQLRERIDADPRPTALLWISDCDPSGVCMAPTILHTLQEEMEVPPERVHIDRVALTEEQIDAYGLTDLGITNSDGRSRHYKGRSVELDALGLERLREILETAILEHIDADPFRREQEIEAEELRRLAEKREQIMAQIGGAA